MAKRTRTVEPPVSVPGRGSEQFALRMPAGLRDRIKAEAKRNARSANTEIVLVLDKAFPAKVQTEDARCDNCIFSRKNSYTNCFRFPRGADEDFLIVSADGWCGEYRPKGGDV